MSLAGIASRREADRLIAEGRVRVNGEVILKLGCKIDEEKDRVEVSGKKVKGEQRKIYVLLNKPPGYIVTLKDPFKRPTVMNLLPRLKTRLFPVGRLDFDSEGLLLLTNDGELANRLIHPRYEIKKVYTVKIEGFPEKKQLSRLEKGVVIEGKKTAPARISPISSTPKRSLYRVEIHEGRKREIRRMFAAIGHPLLQLCRIEFAGLTMRGLKPGQWRYLTAKEVENLKKLVKLNQ